MRRPRLAAIDIGTNSIRCIVVEIGPDGKSRVLDDEKATVRLGEGLRDGGGISPEAMARGIEFLGRMKKIVGGYGVAAVEAVATSAVRRAGNGAEFVERVARETGIEVRVIGGEEEAELALLSALHNFDMAGVRYTLADIGGGSVEIVTGFGSHVEEVHSLELGAVTLTDRFAAGDPWNEKDHQRLRKHIRKTLREALPENGHHSRTLIGSGGTFTAIAGMAMARLREPYGSVHGYEVLRSEVVHLLSMLVRKDLRERRNIPGLNPDRADIIVAGVTVVDELMAAFDVNQFKVNERGIREGLILQSLRKHGLIATEDKSRTWRESALEFARSCHSEEEHALQVARLAQEIFAAVAPAFEMGESERRILEAAALLHDVGYFISYSSHHKHSYHLIRHADLFGFTPRERELIANIARYHRRALPKKKHAPYAALSPDDQRIVSRLGGILRLADGLDRRRNNLVSSVECSLSPYSLMVSISGHEDLSVEMYGGRMKGDLFEEAFGLRLVLVAP